MIKIINYVAWLVVAIIMTISCSSDNAMQNYFVKHQEDPNFLAIDIPSSVLGIASDSTASPDVKEAVQSFKKLNILAFKKNESNADVYQKEKAAIKKILSNKVYKDLMQFKDGNNMIIIKYIGDDTNVDQFIVFGYSNDKGLAIVRILGEKMNLKKVMKVASLAQSGKIDPSQFKGLKKLFNK